MDHVTFWMPVLILAITEDFDELLQDSGVATVATLSELR
jgi:hypothetical protein